MDNLHVRLNFDAGKKRKSITTAGKIIVKLIKLQSLVGNVLKYEKYS